MHHRPPCDFCGAPALVSITNEQGQTNSIRHLCLRCADQEDMPPRQERRLKYSSVLISVGLVLLLLSATADMLGPGQSSGFGWKQDSAVIAAAIVALMATVIRIPTLFVIAAMTGVLALLADLIKFGREPGFGAQQISGVLLGVIFVIAGVFESRRSAGPQMVRSSMRPNSSG